jgi:hypothetical protein
VRPILCASKQSRDENWIRSCLHGFKPSTTSCFHYRIDATILICGTPVFTRKGVGGAYASIESGASDGATAVALQFAAGCWPERARGLNRFGILREVAIERNVDDTEYVFEGLITTSKEESLGDARKSLAASDTGTALTVARGVIRDGRATAWTEHIDVSREFRWTEAARLLRTILHREPASEPHEVSVGRAPTFLAAMRSAASRSQSSYNLPFLHNGKLYRLDLQRRADSASELIGVIRNGMGARTAEFRTSYRAGDQSGIPEVIDYRPKSFLRLSLHAEQEVTRSQIPSIFTEEAF